MIALAIIAALFLLASGTFITMALANWWLEMTLEFDKFGVAAWMAGGVSVFVPMFFGTIAVAVLAFLSISGISV